MIALQMIALQMIALQQRQTLLALIGRACRASARLHKACVVVGLAARAIQRWLHPAAAAGDRRTSEQRTPHVPANKFTEAARQTATDTLSSNALQPIFLSCPIAKAPSRQPHRESAQNADPAGV